MPEMTEDASQDVSAEETAPRRSGGLDDLTRYLLFASAIAIVLVLAMTAAVVYFGAHASDVPRTAVERDFIVSRQAASQKPRDPRAWQMYAASSIAAGKYDDAAGAIAALEKLTRRAIVLMLKGDLAQGKGDLSAARDFYEKAAVQAKKDHDADLASSSEAGVNPATVGASQPEIQAYVALGSLDVQVKDYKSAVTHLKAALKLDPTAADVLVLLGNAQDASGKPKDAESSYRKALQFIPDYKPAREGLKRIQGGR